MERNNYFYFQYLSPENKEKFEINCVTEHSRTFFEAYLDDTADYRPSFSEFIDEAFEWSKTPEGHEYWEEICYSMNGLSYENKMSELLNLETQVKDLTEQINLLTIENQRLKHMVTDAVPYIVNSYTTTQYKYKFQ